ncbi:hypothetical protein KJ567_01710 [Candidatus Bipolaricaulota bacterium]|nr:hypothetical protein [Candidatus Bipolaricaulota bacterium]
MNESERHNILVVVHRSEPQASHRVEQTIQLPRGAGVAELLLEIKRESPEIYPEIRDRILRAAGGVHAYGEAHPLFEGLTKQLADGGPVIFPTQVEEDAWDSKAVA